VVARTAGSFRQQRRPQRLKNGLLGLPACLPARPPSLPPAAATTHFDRFEAAMQVAGNRSTNDCHILRRRFFNQNFGLQICRLIKCYCPISTINRRPPPKIVFVISFINFEDHYKIPPLSKKPANDLAAIELNSSNCVCRRDNNDSKSVLQQQQQQQLYLASRSKKKKKR
jgi:hypothetical protein